LGGEQVWYDDEIRRLNNEGHGKALGEFKGDDKMMVVSSTKYYVTNFDLGHHFPEDTIAVMKYDANITIDAIYFDATQKYFYLKRFQPECNEKMQQFIDDDCTLKHIAYDSRSTIKVTFGGANATRPD
jgi:topoisomerase-4 subunit A